LPLLTLDWLATSAIPKSAERLTVVVKLLSAAFSVNGLQLVGEQLLLDDC